MHLYVANGPRRTRHLSTLSPLCISHVFLLAIVAATMAKGRGFQYHTLQHEGKVKGSFRGWHSIVLLLDPAT